MSGWPYLPYQHGVSGLLHITHMCIRLIGGYAVTWLVRCTSVVHGVGEAAHDIVQKFMTPAQTTVTVY